MANNVLHTISFVRRSNYVADDSGRPDALHSVSANEKMPVPREGEVITYGWYEKDGEKISRIGLGDHQGKDGRAKYKTSQKFKVVAVDHNYQSVEKTSNGRITVSRVEVSTTVSVREYDE